MQDKKVGYTSTLISLSVLHEQPFQERAHQSLVRVRHAIGQWTSERQIVFKTCFVEGYWPLAKEQRRIACSPAASSR